MSYYLGIDLGTSAVKVMLADGNGSTLATSSVGYPVLYPRLGWSEQDPQLWWDATRRAMGEVRPTLAQEF